MTNLGMMIASYQQKYDVENKAMAEAIDISPSMLSRIKSGTMPDALGMAKLIVWMVGAKGGEE